MHPALVPVPYRFIQYDALIAVGEVLDPRRHITDRRWLIAFAEETSRQLKAWAAEERAKLGLPDVD